MQLKAIALLDKLNQSSNNTLMQALDIRYTAVGDDFLEATMPVDTRHHQPMGIVHGGATAALAESVGSAASGIHLMNTGRYAVGLELAINHLRSARSGLLTARAEAIHRGRSTHLWQIFIRDEKQRTVSMAKLTMIVMTPPKTADQATD